MKEAEAEKALQELGCSTSCQRQFHLYLENSNPDGAVHLLQKERSRLLREIHEREKQVEKIDFLKKEISQ